MRKVGILTFHRAVNFGAVLQAYALSFVCNAKCNVQSEIIDYRSSFIENYYRTICLFSPNNWKRLISYLIFNGNLFPQRERIFSFLTEHNCLSARAYTDKSVGNISDEYDVFLSGSDQVWSPYAAGFDKTYFLTFVRDSNKRRSYAASVGVSSIPNQYLRDYKSRLEDYYNYSVREESAKSLLKTILSNKNITVDIDPTLLMNKREWEQSIKSSNVRSSISSLNKYVLLYCISEETEIFSLAKEIGRKLGLEVLYINDRWRKRRKIHNISSCNIDEWISLFLNASFVVTDSFHGTAFSVNFGRPFITYQSRKNKRSTRIVSLLSKIRLENRIINDSNIDGICLPIEFKESSALLDELRKTSLNNLYKIVNE